MSWVHMMKTMAVFSAKIIAALTTEGWSLVINIYLWLNSAYDFFNNVSTLVQLLKGLP